MQRRRFLKLSGLGILLGVGASVSYSFVTPLETIIFSILKEDLAKLKVSEQDLKKYARDAAELNPFHFSFAKVKMISLYSQLSNMGIKTGPYFYKYVQYRSEIVGNFLLSTDFFWSKLTDKDEIRYFGNVFTPYNHPCGNPFSNRYYY